MATYSDQFFSWSNSTLNLFTIYHLKKKNKVFKNQFLNFHFFLIFNFIFYVFNFKIIFFLISQNSSNLISKVNFLMYFYFILFIIIIIIIILFIYYFILFYLLLFILFYFLFLFYFILFYLLCIFYFLFFILFYFIYLFIYLFIFYFILFYFFLSFFFQVFNFKIQFPHFSISKCHKFQNSNIPISNFKFLNLKSQIYKIPSFQFQNLNSKFLSFKFILEFLISNISNYQLQNFNFKSVFKNSKLVINSIVPIKWDFVELICVTYK